MTERESLTTTEGSMREAARSGGRWSLLENFGAQFISTMMTLVLARLVAPEDFGIVAIVTVVTNFLALVTQFGFSASLIQRDVIEDIDRDTMFWTSALLGVVIAVAGVFFSQPLASSFGGERASSFIAVAILALPFNLTSAVFRAVLVRDLRFRPVAVVSALATLGQASVAISLAWAFDAGAWAIIAGKVFRAVAVTVAWAFLSGYVPRLQVSWERFKEHFSFNLGWGAGSVATYVVKNVDYWFVGRLLGESLLGIYYLAYVLPDLVRLRLLGVFRTALFPILSRIKEDRPRFTAAYLEIVQMVSLVTFPAMIGLALVAEPVARVGLSETFLEAAAPMAVVSVAAGFDAMWQLVATALSADGVPGKAFWIVMLRVVVLVGGLAVLVPEFGLLGAAYAVLVASVVVTVVGHWSASRRFRIPAAALAAAMVPTLLPVGVMAAVVWSLDSLLGSVGVPPIVELVTLPLVGATVYVGVLWAAHRDAFRKLMREGKRFLVPAKSS